MATAAVEGVKIGFRTIENVRFTIPDGGIVSDHFTAVAGAELVAAKVQHLFKAGTTFGFAIGGTPTTREEIIFVASSAGTVNKFAALLNADGSTTAISFDLKKNGTTILTGTVDLTDSTGDGVVVPGTIDTAAYVEDDVFSIAMTVTSSTGAQGPFAWAEFIETLN